MENTRTAPSSSVGLLEAIACAALLVFVTNLLPFYFKNWFVEPTGNIKIAPVLGFALALGILLRKEWARQGGIVLAVFLMVVSLSNIIGFSPEKPGYWVVLALSAVLLYGLFFSKNLRAYVRVSLKQLGNNH